MRRVSVLIISILFGGFSLCSAHNIGLLIVATGRYIDFVPPLLKSAEKYFCPNHTVTYFVFTDGIIKCSPEISKKIVRIEQKRLGWPQDTLMRFSMYHAHREKFAKMDYLFATDADMLFENSVGDEILSDGVGTQHPGYVGRRGTYESRPISTAYVKKTEGSIYFAGGFNGGRREGFLRMIEAISKNIDADLKKNIIAVWHDESHVNRYFVDNPPTKVLSPSYCYPDNDTHYKRDIWEERYTRRLVALDKTHALLRR